MLEQLSRQPPKCLPNLCKIDTFSGLGRYLGFQGGPKGAQNQYLVVPGESTIDTFGGLGVTWGPKVVPNEAPREAGSDFRETWGFKFR